MSKYRYLAHLIVIATEIARVKKILAHEVFRTSVSLPRDKVHADDLRGVHGVGVVTIQRNLRPLAGSVGAQNIEIQIEPAWRKTRLAASEALISVSVNIITT